MERGPLSDPKVRDLVAKSFRAAQIVEVDRLAGAKGSEHKKTDKMFELAVVDKDGKLVHTIDAKQARDPVSLLRELKKGLEKAGIDPERGPALPQKKKK